MVWYHTNLESWIIPSVLILSILQTQFLFDIHCTYVWKIINFLLPHFYMNKSKCFLCSTMISYSWQDQSVWGFESPLDRDIFCLKNFDTFPSTSFLVSKINAVSRAQLTFQMSTLLKKNSIPPEPVFKNMGHQRSGPDSSNGKIIRHESEGCGFESPSGRNIFCLKNFDTFTRTSFRVSNINAVAHTELIFQTSTLLKKNSIPPEPVFKNMPQLMSGPDSANG